MPERNRDHLPWRIPHEAMRFSGYRAMREMAAREADSSPIGYGALGMYLLSHALWLADEMQRGGFDRGGVVAAEGPAAAHRAPCGGDGALTKGILSGEPGHRLFIDGVAEC